MPLVRIDLKRGKPESYRQAIGRQVHRALVEIAKVPELDRFQVISEHADGLAYSPTYLDIPHTDDIVLIQVTFNAGRSLATKQALYARIAELLEQDPGVPPEDVIIGLVEVAKENRSFGRGGAPYAETTRPTSDD